MKDLKQISTQDLCNELALRGYQTDNLWHIDDVVVNNKLSDDEAMDVLILALNNESVMEHIFSTIDWIIENKES